MKKTVDVIIPVYKPGKQWKQLIQMLNRQTYPIEHILIMNTGKENWKEEYESWASNMVVEHIQQEDFDHGKTRDQGARKSSADYLLFMTQDAVPADETMVESLIKAFEKQPKIGVAYGRQIPAENCRLAERFTRQFNYPEKSCVKTLEDLPQMGIKTFFCSNVCAMYDREIYVKQKGFVQKTIFNEDMIFAGNLIQSGYAVAYVAEAKVIHSHNYTAVQQFHRNFDLAVSQADHPEIFQGIRSEGEGIRLVKETAKWLCKQGKPWLVVSLVWNSGWKYLGYLMGKRYRKLPKWLILKCTMNGRYWRNL